MASSEFASANLRSQSYKGNREYHASNVEAFFAMWRSRVHTTPSMVASPAPSFFDHMHLKNADASNRAHFPAGGVLGKAEVRMIRRKASAANIAQVSHDGFERVADMNALEDIFHLIRPRQSRQLLHSTQALRSD